MPAKNAKKYANNQTRVRSQSYKYNLSGSKKLDYAMRASPYYATSTKHSSHDHVIGIKSKQRHSGHTRAYNKKYSAKIYQQKS